MYRRIPILLAVLVLALSGVVGLLVALHKHEPLREGKPLSYWLYLNSLPSLEDRSTLGTNAIPFLVLGLQKRDTLLAKEYQRLFPKLPAFLKSRAPQPRFASTYRQNAMRFLSLLAMEQPSAGSMIIRPLEQTLQTNDDPVLRFQAAEVLTSLRRNDPRVVSQLCKAFAIEMDPRLRAHIAYQLRFFGGHPNVVIPTLAQGLKDADPRVRSRAAESLLPFKGNGVATVALLQAVNDASPEVRQAADQTLRAWQPAVLTGPSQSTAER
jgi:HEAT repeat protein